MRCHAAFVGAAIGAIWAPSVPVAVVGVSLVAGLVGRRHAAILGVVLLLVVAGASTRATAGLDLPAAGPFAGWVTLVDDPRSTGPIGVRVTVIADGRRLVATAHGPVSGRLDDHLAGERVRVEGTVRPVSRSDRRSLDRHIVGRLTVERMTDRGGAAPIGSVANAIRRRLSDGASSLSESDHALFLGMVIGDDRGQTPVTADDFRAGGLGHLLVVSGQNVAFVLAVAMPVAGRLRPAGRALLLFALLGGFAVLTRFEPSVLRAVAMAGVGIGSAALGSPLDGRRGLSLALAGLLVIDPFLIRVVAFQLSAAATAGIVWASGPLAERLRGPRWFAVPVATTVSAQLGVSPVLVAIFGPLPLASLPANVLAGPASGAVMMWGCTAGLVAGVVGGTTAEVLHLPTRCLLWWIGGVASFAARAPAASLGAMALAVLAVACLAAIRWPRTSTAAVVVAALIAAGSIADAPRLRDGWTAVSDGATVLRRSGTVIVVLDDPGRPRWLLESLRLTGVRRVDLVVARDGDRADADAALALADRFGAVPIAAPPLHRVPGGRTVRPGQLVRVGAILLAVDVVDPRLGVAEVLE
ncbi:MAG: ComEC/Rec2 family competence protein [Actinomycetota bacterium]